MLDSPLASYHPGTSPIHRLDARVKSVALIVLMACSFLVTTPSQLTLALCGLLVLVAASRVGARSVARASMPIVPFALVVAVFNLLVVSGGTRLVALGALEIWSFGAWAAILYASRLLVAVALGALLLLTTTPTALTDAFESLLAPLSRLGVPAHELSMVLSLALRFVPLLSSEAHSIIDAQAARGGLLTEGGVATRLHTLAAVLVPVFAGALRHAQNLSRALDARCYEGGCGRTRYREQRVGRADLLFSICCVLWLAALLCARS